MPTRPARRALVDELGIEPGEALRDAPAGDPRPRILRSTSRAAAEPPRPSPSAPPAGREASDVSRRETRKTVTVLFAALGFAGRHDRSTPKRCAAWRAGRSSRQHRRRAPRRHGRDAHRRRGDGRVRRPGRARGRRASSRAGRQSISAGSDRSTRTSWAATGPIDSTCDWPRARAKSSPVAGGQLRSTGRPIALAARLGQSEARGSSSLDEATHRLVRDAVDVEPSGEWLRLLAVRDGSPVKRGRFDAPMVGRERERRRLRDSFEQAVG